MLSTPDSGPVGQVKALLRLDCSHTAGVANLSGSAVVGRLQTLERVLRLSLDSLAPLLAPAEHGIDAFVDVRAPAEFAEDHLPGAISLPVLSDAERARVGTVYVRQDRFAGRRLGAALVARNVAAMLDGPLAEKPRDWRPVIYCWRGGQRSGALALVMAQVGWRVRVIEGGYRSYRRLVARALYDRPFPAPLIVLDGNTGTAKTAVLARLAARGVQVLDLEAMARHRGSLFGEMPGGQPAQKAFESALALNMAALDSARPVVVEDESHRIGRIMLPPALWSAMCAAPRLRLEAPLSARAAYLVEGYGDMTAAPERLAARIDALRPFHSRDTVSRWQAWAQVGAFEALAASLLEQHYDPRYRRSRAARAAPLAMLSTPGLRARDLDRLADALHARIIALPEMLPGFLIDGSDNNPQA